MPPGGPARRWAGTRKAALRCASVRPSVRLSPVALASFCLARPAVPSFLFNSLPVGKKKREPSRRPQGRTVTAGPYARRHGPEGCSSFFLRAAGAGDTATWSWSGLCLSRTRRDTHGDTDTPTCHAAVSMHCSGAGPAGSGAARDTSWPLYRLWPGERESEPARRRRGLVFSDEARSPLGRGQAGRQARSAFAGLGSWPSHACSLAQIRANGRR